MNYANTAMQMGQAVSGTLAGYASGLSQAPTPAPLIDQELAAMSEALAGLEDQISWLIDKVAPICQESKVSPLGSGEQTMNTAVSSGAPSRLRAQLIEQRHRLERVMGRLAALKFTIEV